MILLLGATGYIGEAFARELTRRKLSFTPLSRKEIDYSRFDVLLNYLKTKKPTFVINAAGYTGKPNVDAAETARADALIGNAMLPQTIAHACAAVGIPWGHVSSGCIYAGAHVQMDDRSHVELDLTQPAIHAIVEKNPERIHGFKETDAPNFSFRSPPCSFYSGTKALGEEVIAGIGQSYIWRLRIPFDEYDNSRNYLSKLQRYPKVYDNVNSVSHRADFAKACVDLWEMRAPFGTYNITNPGFTTARHVVALIQKYLKPKHDFEFWPNDAEFYKKAAKAPRSNCVLDVSKLLATGVKIRSVEEALEDSLRHWQPETKNSKP